MSTRGRIAALALVTLATTAGLPGRAALAPGRQPETAPRTAGPQEAEVVAVVIDQRTQSCAPALWVVPPPPGRQKTSPGPQQIASPALPVSPDPAIT